MKRLILTPNKDEMCGMYKVAKTLKGDIETHPYRSPLMKLLFPKDRRLSEPNIMEFKYYDEVITLLYPMHLLGKEAKKQGVKWIVYDQEVPPAKLFKSFWKRQYIKLFKNLNNRSMKGADEYWKLSEIEQKPLFNGKVKLIDYTDKVFAIYIGRDEGYKNVKWLKNTCKELGIELMYPQGVSDELIHGLLSNATLLVTASVWEGYGRPVMEAQALGIPVVCFDTGVHKKLVKKGFVVPNHNFNMFKEKVKEAWRIYSPSASSLDSESLISVKRESADSPNSPHIDNENKEEANFS